MGMLDAVRGIISGAFVLFVIAWLFGFAPIETLGVVGTLVGVAWAVEKLNKR